MCASRAPLTPLRLANLQQLQPIELFDLIRQPLQPLALPGLSLCGASFEVRPVRRHAGSVVRLCLRLGGLAVAHVSQLRCARVYVA
jgi:hypothetical protein